CQVRSKSKGRRCAAAFFMSFPRHREIFPSDGGASPAANASAHRLDEFPAGYSSAGWSPPEPASASPAGHQYAGMSSCRSRSFHRTANCVLTVCVTPGGKRKGTISSKVVPVHDQELWPADRRQLQLYAAWAHF